MEWRLLSSSYAKLETTGLYGFFCMFIYVLSPWLSCHLCETGTLSVLFILRVYSQCLVLCLAHGGCSTLNVHLMKKWGDWESEDLDRVILGKSLPLFRPLLPHYLMRFLFGYLLSVSTGMYAPWDQESHQSESLAQNRFSTNTCWMNEWTTEWLNLQKEGIYLGNQMAGISGNFPFSIPWRGCLSGLVLCTLKRA